MPTQTTNYQCPACTGPLHFVGSSGKLECDYCGSSFEVAEIGALYAEKIEKAGDNFQAQQTENSVTDDWGEDAQHMRVYNCPSCGAELFCDDATAATSCPYCGNPTVIPGNFEGILKPDYVIPFALDKQAAINALKKYYKGKKFLPKSFSNSNHISEIKGVYVPFWLYDGEADADMSFTAQRVHTRTTANERITVTEHYRVRRAGTVSFERIPVDASSNMPDNHMDSIEPFDYSKLTDFSPAYLAGFLADKYDVSAEDCAMRADERAKNSAYAAMEATVTGYTGVVTTGKNVRLNHKRKSYALLPVWMLSTKWNGRDFLFAMNGQSGKLVGDLPIDKGKVSAWFAGIALPLMGILAAVLML